MANSSSHSQQSIWATKRHVESLYPHFPSIDVDAKGFDIVQYVTTVREMFQAAHIPVRPFHITWDSLTSTVPLAPEGKSIANVISFIQGFINGVQHGFASLGPKHKESQPAKADVLDNVSGYLKAGQMCLVIGTPGSGTSLLLSRIAGRQMPNLMNTSGQVLYNGKEKLADLVRPSHFIHFIQQNDNHIPQLTVRHTLEFAAQCRWPEWIPHVKYLRRNDVLITAKTLGISRTLDTIVGSDILRGVSGGERKRVTMGEMGIGLVSGTLVMDNWSKGLDSATTLSITRSMRDFAKFADGSVVVSMPAPGSEVFNLFDNLCLLHEGRVIYFGPVTEVESYFNSLGFYRPAHRSVPDFVSTITESKMRSEYVANDNSSHDDDSFTLPTTAEEFASCYNNSSYHEDVKSTIRDLNAAADAEGRPELPPHIAKLGGRYVLQNPYFQLRALATRQARFLSSVRKTVLAEILQNLIFGLILGSIFWQLPDTRGGADSRTGIVFLTLLSISLGALGSLENKFNEKVIFTKQRDSSFFNSWTYLFSQALFDFILEVVKATVMIVPLYFMGGLSIGKSGQRLLYAIIISTFASLTMISLTRLFVAMFSDPNAAQGSAGVLTIIFVLFVGYLKSPDTIQDWLVWIYWINPLHYSFEALIINEFEKLNFPCDENEIGTCVPVSGKEYVFQTLGIDGDNLDLLWLFLIVVAFNFGLFLASAIATAVAKPVGHRQNARADENQDFEQNTPTSDVAITVNEEASSTISHTAFTFTNLTYSVENGTKVLLDGVTGNSVSGKVVLLMGESGAGKTTLLDVCAMRKTLKGKANLSGEVRINGRVVSKESLAHVSGYCEQNDLHIGEATVREAVLFSAKLRLPSSMTLHEKQMRVQSTISQLGLEPHSDILVKALGSGELKLLTMAVEVVSDPKILFLDEPTSGISSSSAMTVARTLQKVAANGTCVICTVHQPSKEVFTMFDRLLLLKRGGKVVYFGDIGENGNAIQSYFESHGAEKMDELMNPADWMLDVIANDEIDWVDEWNESDDKKKMDEDTFELAGSKKVEEEMDGDRAKDRASISTQMIEVIHRQFWRYWRLPEYNTTRMILILCIALLVGILFLQSVDNTQTGARIAFAALFLTLIPTNLSAQNVVIPTASGRAVFYREIAAGLYRPIAYHVAVGLVELPFTVATTTLFAVVFYFMIGFEASKFFYFFLALQVLYTFGVMFGVMMSVLTPSTSIAKTLISVIFSVLNVLSGFFIKKPEMPVWWRWSVWVNPFAYFLSGVLQNQMEGQEFICNKDELAIFELPIQQFKSCSEIPGGVYSEVQNAGIRFCQFCPVPSGDTLINLYDANEVNKWLSILAVFICILIVRVLTGYGFAKLRFLTR